MAQKHIAMDQLKQVLQLKNDGIPIREISRRTGISRNSVRKYLQKLSGVNVSSNSVQLANAAYNRECLDAAEQRMGDLMQHLHLAKLELGKKGVTRQLLWQEYLQQHPDGYGYSQYCYHLQGYLKHADRAMHLEYTAGDMMMIDFAGTKQHYTDPETGEVIACEVFVAVLPYSGLIFCQAVPSQQSAHFCHCINQMLRFYAGAPGTILCDNLKTAVIRPNRYEPKFTDLCYQLSDHYQTTFSAARPRSPRDKAMVELAVKTVYAHVYAPLRHQVFTSLEQLNAAMHQQLHVLNSKPYKNSPYSRWHYYEQHEKTKLKPLPSEVFTSKNVVILTVQRNYHVQLSEDHRYYSVPWQYVGKKVKVMYNEQVVEVYNDEQRIALHFRKSHNKAYTTLAEHMPPNHQYMQQIKGWTKEDLLQQAACLGNSVQQAAAIMLDNSIYVEQNYKACYGMLMLQKKYGTDRLQAACTRALTGTRINYTMIKNILERGLDKQVPEKSLYHPIQHGNIRGPQHYQ
jgi:transposase